MDRGKGEGGGLSRRINYADCHLEEGRFAYSKIVEGRFVLVSCTTMKCVHPALDLLMGGGSGASEAGDELW